MCKLNIVNKHYYEILNQTNIHQFDEHVADKL